MVTLTLHTLYGVENSVNNQTMKLVGYFKKRRLNILIDPGSTHNFLDISVAKSSGCSLEAIEEQKVLVANWERMSRKARV